MSETHRRPSVMETHGSGSRHVAPVTPQDALGHLHRLPSEVMQAWNEMVLSTFDGKRARFRRHQLERAIRDKLCAVKGEGYNPDAEIKRNRNRWMDEALQRFRDVGWESGYFMSILTRNDVFDLACVKTGSTEKKMCSK